MQGDASLQKRVLFVSGLENWKHSKFTVLHGVGGFLIGEFHALVVHLELHFVI